MALDIVAGDVLVVNNHEYTVKVVNTWDNSPQSAAFRRVARMTASTKRLPAMVNGVRSGPQVFLTGLKCTPPDPTSPDLKQRLQIDTPYKLLQTFIADSSGFLHIYVEDVQ